MNRIETIVDIRTGKTTQVEVPMTEEEIEEFHQAHIRSQTRKRAEAMRLEADPLFFKWQAGESTQQEWLDKRQEIRDRYPVE